MAASTSAPSPLVTSVSNPARVDFWRIDFAVVARGMGCKGVRIDRADARGDAIAAARESSRQGVTTVIDVAIDPAASHLPASDY